MEQVLGYPEASAAARLSYEGILELVALPAGLLMIARPVHPAGRPRAGGDVPHPVLRRPAAARPVHAPQRRRSDPAECVSSSCTSPPPAAAPGAWTGSAPVARHRPMPDGRRTTLGILRIGAGCLFIMHGLEKFFSVGGGRIDRDIMTMRGLAGWLEIIRRTADHPRPLHATGRVHPLGRDGGGLLQDRGRREASGKASSCRAWKRRFCSASCSCSCGRPAPGPGVSTICLAA